MEFIPSRRHFEQKLVASNLVRYLEENAAELQLQDSHVYFEFPLYRSDLGQPVISELLIVSPNHGVIAIGTSEETSGERILDSIKQSDEQVNRVFDFLYSRLVRNNNLKKDRTTLQFTCDAVIYAPFVEIESQALDVSSRVLTSDLSVNNYLSGLETTAMTPTLFAELTTTIDGAKGLIRPQPRSVTGKSNTSKGYLANKLEAEIINFDNRQKVGAFSTLDGPQRIRGLAGSGKTVVLAMKAALTHLRYPEASILYTFYTRSLYQHIQRLITRFYRQFDDHDPDWSKLQIMHAWGGQNIPGVYFNACLDHGIQPITFTTAYQRSKDQPFDYVCTQLLNAIEIQPTYDFVIVDEGQDFPASFLRLATKLAEKNRMIFAYDDLQTIFQVSAPTPGEIWGTDKDGKPLVELSEDVVLYKCYRNPREVLVCAHALGFGIYGDRIVQMLENQEHWEDIGYRFIKGAFVEGASIEIERPAEYSLSTISDSQAGSVIVQVTVFEEFAKEVESVAESIKADVEDGLQPNDILVVVVDDRNARTYLEYISQFLTTYEIGFNNIHVDSYGLKDFSQEGKVTLSTVHKAKGNEAYVVYVVGVDALYSSFAGVRERNMLFTAMTRTKGWVRVSGIGSAAEICQQEVETALNNFPYLRFTYPSAQELKIMKRDLAEKAIRKQKLERMLDDVSKEWTQEEITRYLEQRAIKKG